MIFVGLPLAVSLVVSGLIMFLTVIGSPFGLQSFKLVAYVLWPFGSDIIQVNDTAPGCAGNVLWFILGGRAAALLAPVLGLVFMVTIIGIPVGLVVLRMVPLLAFLFGKAVVPRSMGPSYAVGFRSGANT